jgi:MFS family permease
MLSALRERMNRAFTPVVANYWCHVAEGACFCFAVEIINGAVILPALVNRMGYGSIVLGILTAVPGAAVLVQLSAASLTDPVQRKKRLVFFLGIPQRLPYPLIAASLFFLVENHPLIALWAIILASVMAAVAGCVNYAPWIDLLAETIPAQRLSRLFGLRNGISACLGLASAGVCAAIVNKVDYPYNYGTLYLITFGLTLFSWAAFSMVDEVPLRERPSARLHEYLGGLWQVLREDRNFRQFLAYMSFWRVGNAAVPFYTMAAIIKFKMNEVAAIGLFLAAGRIGSIIGNFAFPYAYKRTSHKQVANYGMIIIVGGAALAAALPSAIMLVVVAFIISLGTGAISVTNNPMLMELSPAGRRVAYATLFSAVMNIFGTVAPLAAGFVMNWNYYALAICAAAFTALGLIPLNYCRPQREIILPPETAISEAERA